MSFPLSQLRPVTSPAPLDPMQLVTLVGSRICHDLVNPLSAISNGVELLEMSPGGADGPEFDLINDSVTNANARIRFFRLAFGAASPTDMVTASSIQDILSGLQPAMRQTIEWLPTGEVPRSDVKLAFLLLQCLETAMPYGGTVTVQSAGLNWTFNGQAERFADIDHLWRLITHAAPGGDVTAAQVHFALAATEQDAQAKRIDLVQTATTLNLTVRPA